MNIIQLPKYIIFTDGSRVLTENYKQDLENEDLHLTAEDGHSITFTRTSSGKVVILGYCTPVRSMDIDIKISQETEEELRNLNAMV